MTPDQLRLFDFIRESIVGNGVAPTFQEMARAMGRRNRASVHHMVDRLVQAGLLLRERGRPRGLSLPSAPDVATISTERLEAELRRRGRQPAWSREFLAAIGRPLLPLSGEDARG